MAALLELSLYVCHQDTKSQDSNVTLVLSTVLVATESLGVPSPGEAWCLRQVRARLRLPEERPSPQSKRSLLVVFFLGVAIAIRWGLAYRQRWVSGTSALFFWKHVGHIFHILRYCCRLYMYGTAVAGTWYISNFITLYIMSVCTRRPSGLLILLYYSLW
jgi:hypothetical protein